MKTFKDPKSVLFACLTAVIIIAVIALDYFVLPEKDFTALFIMVFIPIMLSVPLSLMILSAKDLAIEAKERRAGKKLLDDLMKTAPAIFPKSGGTPSVSVLPPDKKISELAGEKITIGSPFGEIKIEVGKDGRSLHVFGGKTSDLKFKLPEKSETPLPRHTAKKAKKTPLSEIVKNPKAVIHAPKREQCEKIENLCRKLNVVRFDGKPYKGNWDFFQGKTCLRPSMGDSDSLGFFSGHKDIYTIYEFGDVDLEK